MLTLKQVNRNLKPYNIELVRGQDYFYFVGKPLESKSNTSVMVYRLNELTLEQWLRAATEILNS